MEDLWIVVSTDSETSEPALEEFFVAVFETERKARIEYEEIKDMMLKVYLCKVIDESYE